MHSCSPSSCTAAFLSRCRHDSHLPTPGHLYLDLTARSWSKMLRGWQARLPWSGLVISQIPKRLSPTFVAPLLCSSLRNVGNADLFLLLALQQAYSEGLVDSHYPPCGCSVGPLHTGWPYSGCGSYPCSAIRWDSLSTAAHSLVLFSMPTSTQAPFPRPRHAQTR